MEYVPSPEGAACIVENGILLYPIHYTIVTALVFGYFTIHIRHLVISQRRANPKKLFYQQDFIDIAFFLFKTFLIYSCVNPPKNYMQLMLLNQLADSSANVSEINVSQIMALKVVESVLYQMDLFYYAIGYQLICYIIYFLLRMLLCCITGSEPHIKVTERLDPRLNTFEKTESEDDKQESKKKVKVSLHKSSAFPFFRKDLEPVPISSHITSHILQLCIHLIIYLVLASTWNDSENIDSPTWKGFNWKLDHIPSSIFYTFIIGMHVVSISFGIYAITTDLKLLYYIVTIPLIMYTILYHISMGAHDCPITILPFSHP
jgi:hypothetical protein